MTIFGNRIFCRQLSLRKAVSFLGRRRVLSLVLLEFLLLLSPIITGNLDPVESFVLADLYRLSVCKLFPWKIQLYDPHGFLGSSKRLNGFWPIFP